MHAYTYACAGVCVRVRAYLRTYLSVRFRVLCCISEIAGTNACAHVCVCTIENYK